MVNDLAKGIKVPLTLFRIERKELCFAIVGYYLVFAAVISFLALWAARRQMTDEL